MSKYPWLNDQPRLASGREWKEQYEQSWASQFEKAEEIFVVVPDSRLEEAQRIILPIQEDMQLPLVWSFQRNPLCLFSRFIKPSSPSPSKLLGQAYIPHCIINISTEKFNPQSSRTMRAHCDMYYWSDESEFMVHKWMVVDTHEGIKGELYLLDDYLRQLDWSLINDRAFEIKTMILLKGNSDGLPKNYEQGQDRPTYKR